MNLSDLQAHCLAKPGATDDHPFGPGALVMKVGGRMFAIIGEDAEPLTISLKCQPELATILRDTYERVRPGYHLNKRHWNTVTIDDTVPEDELLSWIDDSYDLVVASLPRQVRKMLQGTTS